MPILLSGSALEAKSELPWDSAERVRLIRTSSAQDHPVLFLLSVIRICTYRRYLLLVLFYTKDLLKKALEERPSWAR